MILSVINQKGGSGKTATAISIAAYFAHRGRPTLLIDLDQQRNASRILLDNYNLLEPEQTVAVFLQEDPPTLPVYGTHIANLDIAPSHLSLAQADVELFKILNREKNLQESLRPLLSKYEYIILDCPPALGLITINALTASEYVIIPTDASVDGTEGTKLVVDNIQKIQRKLNDRLQIMGILMTMSESTNLTAEVGEILSRHYGELFFKTRIPRNVALGEAHGQRMDIFTYNYKSTSASAYRKLIETEILPKLM